MNSFIPLDWRFIPVHDKVPIWADWPSRGMPHFEPDPGYGIGLVLGPASGGIVAIDFDGPEAWDFAQARFPGISFDEPAVWYSGQVDHCQMSFRVPAEHWADLKTIKVSANKKLEFRWSGAQSVIPPSPHPSGRQYEWIIPPTIANTDVSIPDQFLKFWLDECRRPELVPMPSTTEWTDMPASDRAAMARDLLTIISQGRTPPYDVWRDITWAVAHEVGVEDAQAMMKHVFPEHKFGEYRDLLKGFKTTKAPRMGTLVYEAEKINPQEVAMIKKRYRPGSGLATQVTLEELRASRLFKKGRL